VVSVFRSPSETLDAKARISAIVSHHPDPNHGFLDIIEEMVRKTFEVASAKTVVLEVEKLWM